MVLVTEEHCSSCSGDAKRPTFDFDCLLLGDREVGKSSFVQQLFNGVFDPGYYPTNFSIKSTIQLYTNAGLIIFNIIDCSGDPLALRAKDIGEASCAMIMFDCANGESLRNVPVWAMRIRDILAGRPMIAVGNIKPGSVCHSNTLCTYVSVQSGDNLYAPLLKLARLLTGLKRLVIIGVERSSCYFL